MKIPMDERRALIKNHAKEYRRAAKAKKGQILDVFVEATGYNRVYAARVLRQHGRRIWLKRGKAVQGDIRIRPRRVRPREYGPEVVGPLMQIWACLDYMCGKRLAAALGPTVRALERHGELELAPEVRKKLFRISGATIDRLLAPEKRTLRLRGRTGTKPGSLLKSQIPVRTFAEWDEQEPGFLEVDLVAHDGGSSQGDYVQTLDVTDVCTGWSEQRAVLNKAQVWVFEALQEIRNRLPFPLRGLDSDNGGEFINHHLLEYCEREKLTFTRARPHRKNDTCYVEQKNYSIVRRAVGYGRFVGQDAVDTLNVLYDRLRLRANFFLPSMKLVQKERIGSRIVKRYDQPKTPYERVLEAPEVSESVKRRLRRQYRAVNPAQLAREIRGLNDLLSRLVKRVRPRPTPPQPRLADPPLRSAPSNKKTGERRSRSDTFYVRQ
jgi:hypothetical protein